MALNFLMEDLLEAFDQIKESLGSLLDAGDSNSKTAVMFANLYSLAVNYLKVLEKVADKQLQLEDLVQILGKNNLLLQKTISYLDNYANQLEKVSLAEKLLRDPKDHLGNILIIQKEIAAEDDLIEKLKLQKQLNTESNKLKKQLGSVDSIVAALAAEINRLNLLKSKGNLDKQIELVREEAQTYKEGSSDRVKTEARLQMLLNRRKKLEEQILYTDVQINEAKIGKDPAARLEYYNLILEKTIGTEKLYDSLRIKIAKAEGDIHKQEQIKKYNEEKQAIENTIASLKKEIEIRNQIKQVLSEQLNSALSLGLKIPGFLNLEKNFLNIKKLFEDLNKVITGKSFINSLNSQLKYGLTLMNELNQKLSEAKQKLLNTKIGNISIGDNKQLGQDIQSVADTTLNAVGQIGNAVTQGKGQIENFLGSFGELLNVQAGAVLALLVLKTAIEATIKAIKTAIEVFNKLVDACKKLIDYTTKVGAAFIKTMLDLSGMTTVIKKIQSLFSLLMSYINMQFSFYLLKLYFTEGMELAGEMGRSLANVKAEFEEYLDEVITFANNSATQLGVSTADILKQANAFGGIFRGWGLSAKELALLFLDLLRVATAAMYKTGELYEYFMDKFNSYTAGPRAVSTELNELGLGWAATTDDLRAFSKELGMNFDNMSDNQRKYIEMVYIIKQSSGLLLNFDGYIDSMAFRLNMLSAALDNLKAAFGTLAAEIKYVIIPPIINFINTVLQLITYISLLIKTIFNIPDINVDSTDAVQSIEDVLDALEDATNSLGALDEVDLLLDSLADTIPGFNGGLYDKEPDPGKDTQTDNLWAKDWLIDWESVLGQAQTKVEEIKKTVGDWATRNLSDLQLLAKGVQTIAANALDIALTGVQKYVNEASQSGGIWDRILGNTNNAVDGINRLLEENAELLLIIISELLMLGTHVLEVISQTLDKIFNDPESYEGIVNMIESVRTALESINGWFNTGGTNALLDALLTVLEILTTIVTLVGEVISDLFGDGQYEGSPMQKLVTKIQELLDDILEFLKLPYGKVFIETIADILLFKVEMMILKFRVIFEVIKTILTWIGNFKQKIEETGSVLGALGLILAENLGNTVGLALKYLKDLFDSIVEHWKTKFNSFVDLITHFPDRIKQIWENIKSSFNGVIEYCKQLVDLFLEGFTGGLWDGLLWLLDRNGGKAQSVNGLFTFTPAGLTNRTRAFASGGIVSGRVNALVGEYSNAQTNPEVISPLNKLKSMIGLEDNTRLILAIVNKIDDIDLKLNNIQNKSNDIYLDGQVISRNVVNNINKTTITNGRSPLMA